jgi:DNA recombination protein RmuC
MDFLPPFLAGLALGVALMLLVARLRRREAEAWRERLRETFSALSYEALTRNSEAFLNLAREAFSRQADRGAEALEGKKRLIDQVLETMRKDLRDVQEMVTTLEKDREQKFGELTSRLQNASEQTRRLQETTDRLRAALAGTQARGQWGERMAEDVLRLAGFIEGINYRKQKTLETSSGRPDFTFLLPRGLTVNMDVKFPLDNYLRYLEAEGEADREAYRARFLKDVRGRIREVTTRDYIDPEANTLDYVLVFIPNEQVYAFIQEADAGLLDHAMANRVVLCSPLTLYAILAVMRQAIDNFNLERTAARILSLLGAFQKQWELFAGAFGKLGDRIEAVRKEYDALTSTRRNQLERQLRKIEDLRTEREIPADEDPTEVESSP